MHAFFCFYCFFCPICILLYTLNSTLYFVLFWTEDDRRTVETYFFNFKSVVNFQLSWLHICFYPDLLPKNLKLLTKWVSGIPYIKNPSLLPLKLWAEIFLDATYKINTLKRWKTLTCFQRIKMFPCGFGTFFNWSARFVPQGSWVGQWLLLLPSK